MQGKLICLLMKGIIHALEQEKLYEVIKHI